MFRKLQIMNFFSLILEGIHCSFLNLGQYNASVLKRKEIIYYGLCCTAIRVRLKDNFYLQVFIKYFLLS